MEKFNQLCDDLEQRNNPMNKFSELAHYLFENCCLRIAEQKFYFAELEFYYESDTHPDKFRHAAEEQFFRGEIYWHRSGMDITIGNRDRIYGGVLIRGIQTEGGNVILGPRRLISVAFFPAMNINNAVYNYRKLPQGMRRILPNSPELNQKKPLLCFETGIPRHTIGQIVQSERIGLTKGRFSAQEQDQWENFIHYPYRYYIEMNKSL